MDKAVGARVRTLLELGRSRALELPDCHATGKSAEGYDPSEETCQDCAEKYTCMPLSIERGSLAGDLTMDREVETVLATPGQPVLRLLDFVLQRQAERAKLRAARQAVPERLTIDAPVAPSEPAQTSRRKFEQQPLFGDAELSRGGSPDGAQETAEGSEVPKASSAAARAAETLPRAKTLKRPTKIEQRRSVLSAPAEPPHKKPRKKPMVTTTKRKRPRVSTDKIPPGRARRPRLSRQEVKAQTPTNLNALRAHIAKTLMGTYQAPVPVRRDKTFPLPHALEPHQMKATLAGGDLGSRSATRLGCKVGLEIGQTIVRKKRDGRLVAVRFERNGFFSLNTLELYGSLSSAIQTLEQRRVSGNDFFHFSKRDQVFLFNAKGAMIAHSGVELDDEE